MICVCNELHAAVLRPLRQVAEIAELALPLTLTPKGLILTLTPNP